MMTDLFEAADLDHVEAGAMLAILMPKLWQCSGLDFLTFRDIVLAKWPADVYAKLERGQRGCIPEWAVMMPRRH
jgi:hypothetical protein